MSWLVHLGWLWNHRRILGRHSMCQSLPLPATGDSALPMLVSSSTLLPIDLSWNDSDVPDSVVLPRCVSVSRCRAFILLSSSMLLPSRLMSQRIARACADATCQRLPLPATGGPVARSSHLAQPGRLAGPPCSLELVRHAELAARREGRLARWRSSQAGPSCRIRRLSFLAVA
jgi:hypothetical protein